jgi:hypothetical protein
MNEMKVKTEKKIKIEMLFFVKFFDQHTKKSHLNYERTKIFIKITPKLFNLRGQFHLL